MEETEMANREELREKLHNLQKQLGHKLLFEAALSTVKSLLGRPCPCASSVVSAKLLGGIVVLLRYDFKYIHSMAQSCIKVGLNFVSSENVHECVRLTEEIRVLSQNHSAQEDKLEVKKTILHAVNDTLRNLENPRL